jgi:hypothetical protein
MTLQARPQPGAARGSVNAVCTDKQITVPVVVTRDEVAAVLSLMDGTALVVATRLYGRGRRTMEAVRLRGKDLDE